LGGKLYVVRAQTIEWASAHLTQSEKEGYEFFGLREKENRVKSPSRRKGEKRRPFLADLENDAVIAREGDGCVGKRKGMAVQWASPSRLFWECKRKTGVSRRSKGGTPRNLTRKNKQTTQEESDLGQAWLKEKGGKL